MTLAACLPTAGLLPGYGCDPNFGTITVRNVFNANDLGFALQQSNSVIIPQNPITIDIGATSIINVNNVAVLDPNSLITFVRNSSSGHLFHLWGCSNWLLYGSEYDGKSLATWGVTFGERYTTDNAGGAVPADCYNITLCNAHVHHIRQGANLKAWGGDGFVFDHVWAHDNGVDSVSYCEILYIGDGNDNTAFPNNVLVTDCLLEKSGTLGPGTGEILEVKNGAGRSQGSLTDPKAPGQWDVIVRRTIMQKAKVTSQGAFVSSLHGQLNGIQQVGPRVLLLDSHIAESRKCTTPVANSQGCYDGVGVWHGDGDLRIQGTTITDTDDAGVLSTNVADPSRTLEIVHSTITRNGQSTGEASLKFGQNMSWQPDESWKKIVVECSVFDDQTNDGNPNVTYVNNVAGQTGAALDGNLVPILGGPADDMCSPYTDACGVSSTDAGARQLSSNVPPVATTSTYNTDGPITFPWPCTDADGDPLTFSVGTVTPSSAGTVVNNGDGTGTFTPSATMQPGDQVSIGFSCCDE